MSKRKTLVTGGCGFIGSHLCEMLVERGYDVIAFDRYNSDNHWGWLEQSDYRGEIEVILGDIRDFDSVGKVVQNCSAVFHLAALIGIPYSYVSPLAYIRTNIEGTYNVLEASKTFGLEQVVVTSTSETYGSAQYVPMDENHPAVGQSPYSASKIAADQLALSYFKSFDLPIKIARPFNTYGPRQSLRAVIPTVMLQVLSGEKEIRLGNTTPTRDLTFVSDTCAAILEIGSTDQFFGTATNIGVGQEISILQLVELIGQITNTTLSVLSEDLRIRPKESEVDRLLSDNGKLVEATDWSPTVDLRNGLMITFDWLSREKDNSSIKSQRYHV